MLQRVNAISPGKQSSLDSRLQEQDGDEDRSRVAAGREFQAAGPQTTKLLIQK